jgi:beta-phosphoglucomutase-like phosphatase (HAD superfamily)
MIGDQPRDVQAGRAAGCTTIQLGGSSPCADFISQTLLEATEIVLKETAS